MSSLQALAFSSLPCPPSRRRERRLTHMCVQKVGNPRDFALAMPPDVGSSLVVCNFVTRNCRACSHASRAYQRLAEDFEKREREVSVRFVEMDVSKDEENWKFGQQLGVDVVPSWQFYKFTEGEGGGVGCLDTVTGAFGVGRVKEKVLEFGGEGFDLADWVFRE